MQKSFSPWLVKFPKFLAKITVLNEPSISYKSLMKHRPNFNICRNIFIVTQQNYNITIRNQLEPDQLINWLTVLYCSVNVFIYFWSIYTQIMDNRNKTEYQTISCIATGHFEKIFHQISNDFMHRIYTLWEDFHQSEK